MRLAFSMKHLVGNICNVQFQCKLRGCMNDPGFEGYFTMYRASSVFFHVSLSMKSQIQLFFPVVMDYLDLTHSVS